MKKLWLVALLLFSTSAWAEGDPSIFQSVVSGRKTVTTAGTAEVLAASSSVKGCVVCAEDSNTGTISVGSSNVVATEATRTGVYLLTADCAMIPLNDTANIWVNSTVNGDGCNFNCYR